MIDMSDAIERRLARLEAIEAIKHLKARYCLFCDAQYDPDGIAGLFVPDGVWDGGPTFGRHVGREAIRAYFAAVSGDIRFAAHLVMNPIIDIHDAENATAKWRLLMPCTMRTAEGSEARWLLSEYVDEHVLIDGSWMFRSLNVTVNFMAAHATGWA